MLVILCICTQLKMVLIFELIIWIILVQSGQSSARPPFGKMMQLGCLSVNYNHCSGGVLGLEMEANLAEQKEDGRGCGRCEYAQGICCEGERHCK